MYLIFNMYLLPQNNILKAMNDGLQYLFNSSVAIVQSTPSAYVKEAFDEGCTQVYSRDVSRTSSNKISPMRVPTLLGILQIFGNQSA